jgi:hypothetical protein
VPRPVSRKQAAPGSHLAYTWVIIETAEGNFEFRGAIRAVYDR